MFTNVLKSSKLTVAYQMHVRVLFDDEAAEDDAGILDSVEDSDDSEGNLDLILNLQSVS